jgi:hypothetical protein
MKIELIFTRKDGKQVKIPFTEKELRDIYDALWIADPKDLKMNNIKLNMNKMLFIIHDVMDEGVTYRSTGAKLHVAKSKGKKEKYRYGWKKEINYMVRKPKWS